MAASMKKLPDALRIVLLLFAVTAAGESIAQTTDETCTYQETGKKNLYWGDLHVHTAYSLDAYGYGTLETPPDAYRFARRGAVNLASGARVQLDRRLDFVAITDHAEWFDFMYVCTDPENMDHPDCRNLRKNSTPTTGRSVFTDFVVPSITKDVPAAIGVCAEHPERCAAASLSQWQRIQQQANEANDPCDFSALIGFEWSATPNASHTHRNVIFASDEVTPHAIDYLRFPKLDDLWQQLETHCISARGCDAITIPHNSNLGDGLSFDVEVESDRQLALRARYERLIEVHQEKGNSECLSPFGVRDESDCNFEVRLTRQSASTGIEDFDRPSWERMRGGYARQLLLRGLAGYDRSGDDRRNPLQLGFIGSTDSHTATPGFVEEAAWQGSVFGAGDFDRTMTRVDFNPGGLVAVWAEQNTRASLFDALKRREVYATSGPRIGVRFAASTADTVLDCSSWSDDPNSAVPMGGDFSSTRRAPQFLIQAQYDQTPLQTIEVIKGVWKDGEYRESVTSAWENEGTGKDVCLVWQDPAFATDAPAFWYVRVLEAASPRWSAHLCRQEGRCADYPAADVSVQERAWSSPIWYLPE